MVSGQSLEELDWPRRTRRPGRNLAPSRKSQRPSRRLARLPPPLAQTRGSDGGQPLASDPTAARQGRPASFACVAGQKTVLAFPSNLRWLVLTFHANALAVPHPGPHGKSRCHRGLRGVRPISKRRDNTSEPGCVKRVRHPPALLSFTTFRPPGLGRTLTRTRPPDFTQFGLTTQPSTAFCVCNRFSASSKIVAAFASNVAASISLPR